jgi:hypothetical protein
MVVDMIEPFATNSRVWGFNLLSSPARDQAWKKAQETGQKTFTRRLNLVQSSSAEYGFLVWLPIFSKADGEWTTALDGETTGLTPVGSVNGVYRAQRLLTSAIENTYDASDQLKGVTVFLYDNAEELGGDAQFLGVYGSSEANPYETFGGQSIGQATQSSENAWLVQEEQIQVGNTDARWTVIVAASDTYLRDRRTNNAWYSLIISVVMLIGGAMERWLGHPALLVEWINAYQQEAV